MAVSTHPCYDPAMPASQAKDYLGFGHVESLRRKVRNGEIRAIREGGPSSALRFRLSELNRYLASLE